MFNSNYNCITDKLPLSLVKRSYYRLLNHSRDPISLEEISRKTDQIEKYLHHILEIYVRSSNQRRKTMDLKKLRPQSWPECSASLSEKLLYVYVADMGTQADNNTCNQESEINHQVIKELD